jgi:hypothetical protein
MNIVIENSCSGNINTGCTYINLASDILWLCLVLFFCYKSWSIRPPTCEKSR